MKRIRQDGTVEEVNKGKKYVRCVSNWGDWNNDGVHERREAKERGLTVEELRASRERVKRQRERQIKRNEIKKKVIDIILAPCVWVVIIINWPFNWLKKKSTYYHQLAICYWSLVLASLSIWLSLRIYEKHGFNPMMIIMSLYACVHILDFIVKRLKFRKLIMELVVQNFNNEEDHI